MKLVVVKNNFQILLVPNYRDLLRTLTTSIASDPIDNKIGTVKQNMRHALRKNLLPLSLEISASSRSTF